MRLCPYCGKKVRTVGAIRPNKYGDITGYVQCKNCNIKMHVFIDKEKDIILGEVPKYNQYSKADLDYMEHCHKEARTRRVVLNLRQKKQDTGIVIDISNLPQQNISLEELQKRLDSILDN